MALTEADVLARLATVVDPFAGRDFVAAKSVKRVQIDGNDVMIDIVIGYPAKSQHGHLEERSSVTRSPPCRRSARSRSI